MSDRKMIWNLTGIVFFLILSPFFIAGLVVGAVWDMFYTGFFWGNAFLMNCLHYDPRGKT